uniref:NADH-ubiquinone oxidoreductase chain 4 n=1 Tax=Vespidae sp. MT-2014 TaxID=1560025 RepID=A0A0A0RW79_9HYME|nr:NADH dehydrogenase subunit 4 [Vespidae sp. MT-2014]
MMKFLMMMVISFGLFFFNNKFNKFIICFFLSMNMFLLNTYTTNLWIGGMNLFYMDYYSFYLIILSLWLIGCILLLNLSNFLMLMIYMLMNILVLCFLVFNLMMFYLLFEMSLLPMFFIIMIGGYTFERLEAVMYMFMYTVISSMPFLWMILNMYLNFKSLMIIYMIFGMIELGWLMYYIFLFTFLIKIPMFIFHIWLPKAHVEAPVYGSMILAGVLLKLGSYGVLRLIQIFMIDSIVYGFYLISLSVIGGILMGGVCLIQVDLKMLVAYSSVVHMSLMIAGMLTLTKMGLIGGFMMMLAHGLCSSGLFYLVNLNYERLGSRLMFINKGSLMINPSLGLFWFLLCSSNLAAPVSLNLVSEIFLLISLICWNFKLMMFMMILSFVSAVYSLYLFSFSQHGGLINLLMNYKPVNLKDFFLLMVHWVPLNILFLNLGLFMSI